MNLKQRGAGFRHAKSALLCCGHELTLVWYIMHWLSCGIGTHTSFSPGGHLTIPYPNEFPGNTTFHEMYLDLK